MTARYDVCVHPSWAVSSTDCDLDHVAPFDHEDPEQGAWTIRDPHGRDYLTGPGD